MLAHAIVGEDDAVPFGLVSLCVDDAYMYNRLLGLEHRAQEICDGLWL